MLSPLPSGEADTSPRVSGEGSSHTSSLPSLTCLSASSNPCVLFCVILSGVRGVEGPRCPGFRARDQRDACCPHPRGDMNVVGRPCVCDTSRHAASDLSRHPRERQGLSILGSPFLRRKGGQGVRFLLEASTLPLKTPTPNPARIRIDGHPIRPNRPLRLETRITSGRTVRIKNPLTIRIPIVSSLGPEQPAKFFSSQRQYCPHSDF